MLLLVVCIYSIFICIYLYFVFDLISRSSKDPRFAVCPDGSMDCPLKKGSNPSRWMPLIKLCRTHQTRAL